MVSLDNGTGDFEPQEVRVIQKIGTGSFSEVYLVELNGAEAAAKVVHAIGNHAKVIEREVSILQKVTHPNLVACLGTHKVDRYAYILQEYCAGGCLFELLHNRDDVETSIQQAWQWLHDAACAMEHLHDNSIIHRDLKSLNCLLMHVVSLPTDRVTLKVADFGLGRTKEVGQEWGKMTMAAGTSHWMAPEVYHGSDYAEPVDVYSYSMLTFEIVCREIPFEEHEPAAVGRICLAGGRPDLEAVPPDCPSVLRDLMIAGWAHDPCKRPTFKTVRALLEGERDLVMAGAAPWTDPSNLPRPSLKPGLTSPGSSDTIGTDSPAVQALLPEDGLSLPEPDQEPHEYISDALRVQVRCERSRVSASRQELTGMITIACPEDHRTFGALLQVAQPFEEPEPAGPGKDRLGLDIVLVLDVSASMSGKKLLMLKQAARRMVRELGSHDRLAIVSFSVMARERLNFRRMDEPGRIAAEGVLEALQVESQTSIAAGLRLGIGLADARRQSNPVSGLLLLTDGQNNCGTIPPTLVSEARNRGLSVYAFGIGEDHDAALLGRLAEQARTPVAYIETPEALAGVFAATIGGLLSVRARDVELRVSCLGCTELRDAHSPYLEELSPAEARFRVPDLFAGERRDILLDLHAPSGHELLEVSVRFRDGHGWSCLPKCTLQISRGEPEAEPADEITAQRERLAVSSLLKQALQGGRAGHVIRARQTLEEALQRPWRPEHRAEVADALDRLSAAAPASRAAGFASLADVAQMHSHQRCLYSSPGLGGSNSTYLTNGQLQAIARST